MKKGIKSFPVNSISRFVSALWVRGIPTKARYYKNISNKRGEFELNGGEVYNKYDTKRGGDKDIEVFTKFYHGNFDLLHGLSNTGKSLFFYIGSYLEMGVIEIRLNPADLTNRFGLKSPTRIYAAIVELLEKDIIERADGVDSYFVNIRLLYNGSRDKYLTANQKKK